MKINYCFYYKIYNRYENYNRYTQGNYYSEIADIDIHDIKIIENDILKDLTSDYYVIFESISKL
jgi:hypothetical protein